MIPIDDEELSALLDGELAAERTGEVRTALAADPALADRFATLERLDARLRRAADAASFEPCVALAPAASQARKRDEWARTAAAAVGLVALRAVSRIDPLEGIGLALQLAALAAIVLLLVRSAAGPDFGRQAFA